MSLERGCLCDIDKFIYVSATLTNSYMYLERGCLCDIDKFIYVSGGRMSVRH